MSIPADDEDAGMEDLQDAHEQAKQALSNEAAEWFVRLRDDRLGMSHRERNLRWLKESPAHIAELLRIQQVYKVLRAADLQDRPSGSHAVSTDAPSNVIDLMPHLALPEPTRPRRRFQSWKIAVAVACTMLALLLGFMFKVIWLDRTLQTELGQWRTVQLVDGTQVHVGPDSRLRISFGDDHRIVELLRGEATFRVAKDPSRPFLVETEIVSVLAVGTEFRVSHRSGKDVVAVTEGSVAVYRTPARIATATGGLALAAGEQVSVTW